MTRAVGNSSYPVAYKSQVSGKEHPAQSWFDFFLNKQSKFVVFKNKDLKYISDMQLRSMLAIGEEDELGASVTNN